MLVLQRNGDPSDAIERFLLVGAFAAWVVNAVARWWMAVPLGHDEAQYALAARDLLHGTSARWLYLSPGMNVVAVPGLLLGGTEHALRILPMILGTAFLGACWYFARTFCSRRAAAWLVAVLATASPLVRLDSELLSDLPSAAALLLALAIATRELQRHGGPTRRLVVVAPLLAGAFYVRYGACVAVALLTLAWCAMYFRAITSNLRVVAASGVVLVVCLVPYFVYSIRTTGSLLGLLGVSRSTAAEAAGGLAAYMTLEPFRTYGLLLFPAIAAGILLPVDGARGWIVRGASIGVVLVTAVTGPAHFRYIVVPLVLLATIGIDAIGRLPLGSARTPLRLLLVAGVAMAWIAGLVAVPGYRRVRQAATSATMRASAAIRADAVGQPCFVIGRHLTQLEWYSGCTATREVPNPSAAPVYVVVDDTGGPDQPDLRAFPPARRVAGDSRFTVVEIR